MTEDEMSKKELSYEPIRLMEIDLQNNRQKWLTKYGWEESCDFPDSCWRWCKTIDGKMMMCRESEAIKIERDFVVEDIDLA